MCVCVCVCVCFMCVCVCVCVFVCLSVRKVKFIFGIVKHMFIKYEYHC